MEEKDTRNDNKRKRKSKVIVISRNDTWINIRKEGSNLRQLTEYKYLGVWNLSSTKMKKPWVTNRELNSKLQAMEMKYLKRIQGITKRGRYQNGVDVKKRQERKRECFYRILNKF